MRTQPHHNRYVLYRGVAGRYGHGEVTPDVMDQFPNAKVGA